VTDTGLDTEIARLTDMGFLSKRASDILDRPMLEGFFRSEFFKRLRTAVRVERELKFNRLVPLSSLTESQILAGIVGDRTLMVRGSVDLLCEYPDGHLELCDYKTDHVTSAERRDPSLLKTRLIETHRDQIRQYAAAMAELYGKAPTHAYIFSLPMGEAYEIPL
jgi:ATP-dependent exoDNAse (exonuclease V) beta subunit